MNVFDGMILTDAQADALPAWLTDENSALELLAADAVPTPESPQPARLWRLHLLERP